MFESTFMIDVDFTICKAPKVNGKYDYENAEPIQSMIDRINEMYDNNNRIVLYTARNMNTYKEDVSLINKYTRPILEKWLKEHNVKYHELIMGKKTYIDTPTYYIGDEVLTINQFMHFNDFKVIKEYNCRM